MSQRVFRILDLGAHDGFVTNFIARQAKQAGRKLRVDGVEANPDAVKLFNKRARRDKITGRCKQGLAENAPALFNAGEYDAVVAFELLEHAPNPQELLFVAESMCKPGGRVYVSTPNGTFGAGNNPHHLRVWAMTDLFDLVRRRGYVNDALPGPDGVSVISYTPCWPALDPLGGDPRKEVAIFTGGGWEPWAPSDIESKGLGGSETAAIRLAETLSSDYGCRVTVYGEVAPGAVGQVVYRHYTAFDPMERRDLVIVSRIPQVFSRQVNAERKLLWMHDTDAGEYFQPELAEQIDKVMCLSRWHHDHLTKLYPFLRDKLYITRNGIEPLYFEQAPDDPARNPHRAVYSSSPDRGLDLLLEWWPEVRERIPDAELYFCYSSVYDAVAAKDPRIASFRDRIRELERQEGVMNVGSQNQPSLAKLMMQSGVWLAPSYSSPANVPFHETFCIGAVEAAAAGCVRVMSSWGALEERDEAENSWWVGADPKTNLPDKELFIEAIVAAMESKHHHPSGRALEMDWREVGADMLAAAFQPESD